MEKNISEEILRPWSYLKNLNETQASPKVIPIVQVVNGLGKIFQTAPNIVEKVAEIVNELANVSYVNDDLLFEAGADVKSANSLFGIPVTVTAANFSSTELFKKALELENGNFFLDFVSTLENEAEAVESEICLKRNNFNDLPSLEQFRLISSARARYELEFVQQVFKSTSSPLKNEKVLKGLIENLCELLTEMKNLKNLRHDISCGRMNSIIVHAFEHKLMPEERKKELLNLMTTNSISSLEGIKFLTNCGALEAAKQRIENKRKQVLEQLKENYAELLSSDLINIISSL